MTRPPDQHDEQGQAGLALLVVVVALAAAGNPVVAAAFTGAWGQLDGYATANDATLAACTRGGGRTSVGVRSAGGGREGLQATASAVADHQAPACAVAPERPAGTEPGEEAAPPEAETAAATRLLVCRGHGAQAFVETDVATGEVVATSPPSQWRKTFTVRLVE